MNFWPILKPYLNTVLLVIFFFTEAFSKYSIRFLGDKSDIPKIIKLIILVFFVIGLLKKDAKKLIFPLFLGLSFVFGQLFIDDGFNGEIIVSFSKFIFPIILFLYFLEYNTDPLPSQYFFKVFEFLIIVNTTLILMGFLFDIPFFSTYHGHRFGYNGLFITSATASYAYIIAVFYFLISLRENFLFNWKSLFVITVSFLMGTKAVYLGVFASILVYLLFYAKLSKVTKIALLSGCLIIVAGLFYIFFFQFGIFNELRKEEGLITSILSLRNDLLMDGTIPFIERNWGLTNYLFGGINDLTTRSQMGLIDVFYFWGLLGGIFYLIIFCKTYITFPLGKQVLCLLISLLCIVFLAGNFFENASIAIYLIVFREAVLNQNVNRYA